MREIVEFNELKSQVAGFVVPIPSLTVSNYQDAKTAVEHGKVIKEMVGRIEKTRKSLVGPLNDQVKEINEYAKEVMAPLVGAESHLKRQIVLFETAQEKIRQEKLRLAEEERQKRESEIRAQHETEQSAAAIFGDSQGEQERREVETKAPSAEFKEAAWDIENNRVKNLRKTWKCEMTDVTRVPKEFLIVTLNEKAVLAAARAGVVEIPGVRIWEEMGVAFGSKTYVPRGALGGDNL